MKLLTNGLKWFTAVAVAVAGIGLGGGSLVAPDPAFAKFDVGNLTINGDIRVRPEFRRGRNFGFSQNNQQFTQQRIRLGFGYDVSPDVKYFLEIQDSRNWGTTDTGSGLNAQNNPADSIGVRQGYIGIKNAGVRGLSLKIGRQKIILGDHRLIGSFDWNNNGWSFDGVRADYASPMADHSLYWIRVVETDCGDINANQCTVAGNASSDADLVILYNTIKKILPGGTIEPYVMYLFDGRTLGAVGAGGGGTKAARTQADQKRWFFGTRINGKAVNKMVDYTGEVVWQTGRQDDGSGSNQDNSINAWATAIKAGVTLHDVMWKPRFGFEFDYASGSAADAEDLTGRHTFEGLFPTNHLYFGFMDFGAWKNMVDYNPQIQVKPDKNSKLDLRFHILRLAQVEDNWYSAGQGVVGGGTVVGNQAASLGNEIDIVYTRKMKEGKVGFQIGYGHFFPGEYHARSQEGTGGAASLGNTSMDWGYFQVTTKF